MLGEYLLNKRISFLTTSCSVSSSYRVFSPLKKKVNYTAKEKIKEANLFPHYDPSLLPVYDEADARRSLPYFNERVSGHGRKDALNRAKCTVILLSRQSPD